MRCVSQPAKRFTLKRVYMNKDPYEGTAVSQPAKRFTLKRSVHLSIAVHLSVSQPAKRFTLKRWFSFHEAGSERSFPARQKIYPEAG